MSFKNWWPGFGRKTGYRAKKTRMGSGLRPRPQPKQPPGREPLRRSYFVPEQPAQAPSRP